MWKIEELSCWLGRCAIDANVCHLYTSDAFSPAGITSESKSRANRKPRATAKTVIFQLHAAKETYIHKFNVGSERWECSVSLHLYDYIGTTLVDSVWAVMITIYNFLFFGNLVFLVSGVALPDAAVLRPTRIVNGRDVGEGTPKIKALKPLKYFIVTTISKGKYRGKFHCNGAITREPDPTSAAVLWWVPCGWSRLLTVSKSHTSSKNVKTISMHL